MSLFSPMFRLIIALFFLSGIISTSIDVVSAADITPQEKKLVRAAKKRGVTGELLLQFLERRLDSVVYRLGFASSRNQARQLVRHGHIQVNGRRVDIPSFLVKAGDEVALQQKIWKNLLVRAALDAASGRGVPAWLSLEKNQFKGQVLELPTREHVSLAIEESLVVELYSK